ncbi:hypothetical protein DICVIV_06472 [Dictyocaulus viviparus]|uniref:TAR DNA-binding protein 43 N-terminal domain-containing protein n=1 Tax=Dictyocaulus viviparus TaxID=29172 RepID=A0A0D8XYK6_DICVI|nr:hypothetical protein DICVIV_06472 [Dictyocaulus viviparus]
MEVRSLRVFVEAADIELDDDGSLLWATLQTAFPGCSGMYYRDGDVDCRTAVKFDGQRFFPPGGAWNDRRYYVTLSQSCHTSGRHFSTYENASKQFERSVAAVQKMFENNLFEFPYHTRRRNVKSSTETYANCKVNTDMGERPNVIQDRDQQLQISSALKISPIEQQFSDLAKIISAKDVIIDQQRGELRKISESLQNAEKEIKKYQDQCGELEARIRAMEDELRMLQVMSTEQNYLGGKVTELTSSLLCKDAELSKTREELETQNNLLSHELREVREKCSSLALEYEKVTEKCAELSEQLHLATVSRDLLTEELAALRPLANAIDINNADGVMAYLDAKDNARRHQAEAARAKAVAQEIQLRFDELSELQTTVIQENTRLLQRNSEIEERALNFENELKTLNDGWKIRMEKEKQVWDEARKEIESECSSLKMQIVSLQDVLDAVTREATESSRRAEELGISRDELKRLLQIAEYKIQVRTENYTSTF